VQPSSLNFHSKIGIDIAAKEKRWTGQEWIRGFLFPPLRVRALIGSPAL